MLGSRSAFSLLISPARSLALSLSLSLSLNRPKYLNIYLSLSLSLIISSTSLLHPFIDLLFTKLPTFRKKSSSSIDAVVVGRVMRVRQ